MLPDTFLHLLFTVTMLAAVPALQPIAIGNVTPAADGVYERVLQRRIHWEQIHFRWGYVPDCLCVLNGNYVGRYAVVIYDHPLPNGWNWEMCLIVDVAQETHVAEREAQNLVLEMNWRTWKHNGGGKVAVMLLERQRQ